jgi:type III secretion system YscI/HrpB-like protein
MDANRTLSSYYLESLLNAKLVGKGVQSLEKLTNMQ